MTIKRLYRKTQRKILSSNNLPIFTDTKFEYNVRLSGISLIQLRLLLDYTNILVAHVNIALLEMI